MKLRKMENCYRLFLLLVVAGIFLCGVVCACLISYVRSVCSWRSLAGSGTQRFRVVVACVEFLFLLGEKVVVFAKRP